MIRMANRKAAGDNKIPLETYMYVTGNNFNSFYTIIVDFWNDTHDPDEFHIAKLCVLPKKGNLHLPKLPGYVPPGCCVKSYQHEYC